jgi:prepilin peptidase CpaA
MIILVEAIELTLFPAMMAFAASSDLFTMTIANRVSTFWSAASACSPP